ncbi:HNH endonuclease [Bifidobacterium sp. ESL0690]|uniref:HNH endonuclease n=1 Tax=Bifidobacterium sp. ESL0690 TaxID=2983214 RepID=UPI0023F673B1|nr:HNH endonuclease [Bifidobacterium sp. ESL0690]WEV47019.1 HNH endonuclease [Bifidobacterium sp. ESL0690]
MAKRRTRGTINPRVRTEVIDLYGNDCWLELPGCKGVGASDDHIIPFKAGGRGTVANIRRACLACNISRSNRVLSGYGATIHAVIGPPCAGKTTFVAEHADADALVLDFDRLAEALMPGVDVKHGPTAPLIGTAQSAWQGAYRSLVRINAPVQVWLIKSLPMSRKHPRMLDEWVALDYDIHVVDPGADVVFPRLDSERRNEGAHLTARQWYALHLSQQLIDSRQSVRRVRLAALGLRSSPVPSGRPEW